MKLLFITAFVGLLLICSAVPLNADDVVDDVALEKEDEGSSPAASSIPPSQQKERAIEIFEAATEWREVLPHHHLPGGLEVHMDLSTGKKFARELPPRDRGNGRRPSSSPSKGLRKEKDVKIRDDVAPSPPFETAAVEETAATSSGDGVHTIVVGDETVQLRKGEKATLTFSDAAALTVVEDEEGREEGKEAEVGTLLSGGAQNTSRKAKREEAAAKARELLEKKGAEKPPKEFDEVQNINDLLAWAIEHSDGEALRRLQEVATTDGDSGTTETEAIAGRTVEELRERVAEYGSELMKLIFPSDATLIKEQVALLLNASSSLEDRLDALEVVEELAHQIDNANDFAVLGVYPALRASLGQERDAAERRKAVWTVGTAVQNNPTSQDKMLLEGFLPLVLSMADVTNVTAGYEDFPTINKALFALSAFIRSNSAAQDEFILLRGPHKLSLLQQRAFAAVTSSHSQQHSSTKQDETADESGVSDRREAIKTLKKVSSLVGDLFEEDAIVGGRTDRPLLEALAETDLLKTTALSASSLCSTASLSSEGEKGPNGAVPLSELYSAIEDELRSCLHLRVALRRTPVANFVVDGHVRAAAMQCSAMLESAKEKEAKRASSSSSSAAAAAASAGENEEDEDVAGSSFIDEVLSVARRVLADDW